MLIIGIVYVRKYDTLSKYILEDNKHISYIKLIKFLASNELMSNKCKIQILHKNVNFIIKVKSNSYAFSKMYSNVNSSENLFSQDI